MGAVNVVGEILTIPGDKVLTIGEDMSVVAADAVMRSAAMEEVGNALAL